MPYFLLDIGRPTGYWVLDGCAYWIMDALRAIGYWTASPIGYRLETSSIARLSSLS